MSASAPPPPIEVHSLTKEFGPIRAVDNLSFAVQQGEIVGLLGPNGAGKTTTLRMLTGGLFPTRGEVRLRGFDVLREGPRARAQLGYLPEQMPLYGEMSVVGYLSFIASIKGIADPARDGALEGVRRRLDLDTVWTRPTSALSRGFRQRVGLAQALIGDPDLLVLDEPTVGLDPNQIGSFRALVRRLGRDHAVLLSTHILPEALEVCDRVMILHKGRLVASDRPGRLAGDETATGTFIAKVRHDRQPVLDDPQPRIVAPEGPGRWRIEGDWDDPQAMMVLRQLVEQGVTVLEWRRGAGGLEETFRRLTLGEETP